MKSELPKVVHPILGKPMVSYVIEAVRTAGAQQIILVTGYKSELVKSMLNDEKLSFVEQKEQLGTGHAVQCYAEGKPQRPEHLLVVCGDTPLLAKATLKQMIDTHLSELPAITMMTLKMQNPGNYGRIIRSNNSIAAIREAKDCTSEELEIKEVNLAVYLFRSDFLFANIFALDNNNRQKEFYLTDLVAMAAAQGEKVIACEEKDESSTLGINSRQHLAMVGNILQKQILDHHMENGVTIIAPTQTLIGPDCQIEPDTTIWPGCVITGHSQIGKNSFIGPHCQIHDSKLGKSCKVRFAVVENSRIEPGSELPPFTLIADEHKTSN
jgi:bifunctional UDP-N-acetylglucosamine pyrophosphorylase/glucosamine-1-phosphate N-acetyltransferase